MTRAIPKDNYRLEVTRALCRHRVSVAGRFPDSAGCLVLSTKSPQSAAVYARFGQCGGNIGNRGGLMPEVADVRSNSCFVRLVSSRSEGDSPGQFHCGRTCRPG